MNTPRSAETQQILNNGRAGTSHSHTLRVGAEVMSAGFWNVNDETEEVKRSRLRLLAPQEKRVDEALSSLHHTTLKHFAF